MPHCKNTKTIREISKSFEKNTCVLGLYVYLCTVNVAKSTTTL